ncbi:MAG: hypothetical protein ABFE07_17230 [Armatimonadia bacterium]
MSSTTFAFLPKLSEYDPADTAEGSIDPLGLYPVAEALGIRLAPGVRERQSRVRFLTTSAVSLHLCFAFGDDQIAADGVSEPWQVFEWYVVEGLVRRRGQDDLSGVPGQNKVGSAIGQGKAVSATTYLKAASTFGFHGVYRVLARELGIEVGGLAGEAASQLLEVWEKEQGLDGFRAGRGGDGGKWYAVWEAAIQDGLQAAAVSRKHGWNGWQFVADHLHPTRLGPRERKLLTELLIRESQGFRDRLIHHFIAPQAQSVWQAASSEREIHNLLAQAADGEFRALLQAIQTYEAFARLLQNAFEDMLFAMSRSLRRANPRELAAEPGVLAAADAIPRLYATLNEQLDPFGQAARLTSSFGRFADPMNPAELAESVLLHHVEVQQVKPPHGKAPWCERFDDGSYLVRPAYRRAEGATLDDRYVHGYRSRTLMTFIQDLALVN